MPATIRNRKSRSITFTSALLLGSCLVAPVFAAEIEVVTVTAEKKAEDIQSVPIAVSAFSGEDLSRKQITGFADLQFNIPSVYFSHGNFGPSNFSIRGIGSLAVTTSGDAGVSVNVNDIYLSSPPLTTATYYDVERLEVLRGPQSTLYGRNATGGAINTITAKPNVDEFKSDIEATYGNFNGKEVRAMVNVPLVEGQLGLRLAGFWESRDGTIDNVFASTHAGVASKIDSRHDYSLRGSLRWQPSDKTTVDLVLSASNESDSRVRAQKQLCHRDSSGVLGCLPDKLADEAINGNATFGTLFASNIGPLGSFGPVSFLPIFDVADTTNGAFLGLGGPGLGATAVVPQSLRKVSTDFTPFTRGYNQFGNFEWKQNWSSWLTMNVLFGYDHNSGRSQESYSNAVGDTFASIGPTLTQTLFGLTPAFGTNSLQISQNTFCFFGLAPTNCSTYYGSAFGPKIGTLPVDAVGKNGTTGLNILKYSNRVFAYDQIDGANTEWTGEVRFASNFDGPLNFLIAGYHLSNTNDAHYFVNANTLDLMGIDLGPLLAGNGFVLSPMQYDNNNNRYDLTSNAVFGELYWDAIPDTLKFTGGLRYSSDHKFFSSKQTLFNTVQPIGTQTVPGVFVTQAANFHAWTGRFVMDWTPKLDWTDQTNIYASYSRGYRSGGFNPPSFTNAFPPTFAPETLDAIEVGAKNTLPFLGGTLQANLDAWYYNYKGFQVSAIIDRTSVNSNINSKLWGVEGEFFYAPDDRWQFNLNTGFTNSRIGNTSQVDPRDPTQDAANATLLKDDLGANCSIFNTAGAAPSAATSPAFNAMFATPPTATSAASSPITNVAAQAFFLQRGFSCSNLSSANQLFNSVGGGAAGVAAIAAVGPLNPNPNRRFLTVAQAGAVASIYSAGYRYEFGVPVSLSGNEMPNTPKWTVSVGAQYTMPLENDFNIVTRVDYYWKDRSFGRIFNAGADRIKAWDVANASMQLNAPDDQWYARAWVKNIFDKANITGMYITDPSSALFTNVFVGEPRTYGLTVGAHF
ncbi:MAG: TonB-dependent receptor [Proteobacteria bacterium]|nr:TonB-dependent receptor [Pseudomonadota bacterium]